MDARLRLDPGEHAVVWFGAGVSIPSGLPSAVRFVEQWLAYLLPEEEAAFLSSFFAEHHKLLGKSTPRMEKVIEDAVIAHGEGCLELLSCFGDVPPNEDHRRIAAYLEARRTWAVTTNFDACVESAGSAIPIHTPHTTSPDGWGLVKIHGSIGEPLAALGHSVRNLVRGVAPSLRTHLVELLCDPTSVHVFVGYSGSDFFDVVPFFREMGRPLRSARAVWIFHDRCVFRPEPRDAIAEGPRTMLDAFTRSSALRGDTSEALDGLLNVPVSRSVPAKRLPWDRRWPTLFRPEPARAWLYAAKLHASLGMGERSFAACRRALAAGLPRSPMIDDLLGNALRDSGRYAAELRFRDKLPAVHAAPALALKRQRHRAAALRLSRRTLQAWIAYDALMRRAHEQHPLTGDVAEELVWAIAEAGLFYRDFLIRLPAGAGPLGRVLAPLMAFFKRRVLTAVHIAENLLPRTSLDPHLLATLQRLRHVVATSGPGGLPLGFYEDVLRGQVPVPTLDPLELGADAESLYAETDSILGRLNALREHARTMARVAVAVPITGGPHARSALLCAALATVERSLRLAELIDDAPGCLKAAELGARIAGTLGSAEQARWKADAAQRRATLARRDRVMPQGFHEV